MNYSQISQIHKAALNARRTQNVRLAANDLVQSLFSLWNLRNPRIIFAVNEMR